MRCRPLRWLWGLLPLALIGLLVLLGERPRIEADLTARTKAALELWNATLSQRRKLIRLR